MDGRQRLSRRAKLQGVDYAVLSTGQQIPEYSSEASSSDEDATYGGSRKKQRRRRRRKHDALNTEPQDMEQQEQQDMEHPEPARRKRRSEAPAACFICQKASKSPFMQCEICARWYHHRCWKPFESASVLGNTSCHEGSNAVRRPPASAGAAKQPMASLADFVRVLRRAKKVLVVAGAGMSVSCGIPDFRSKDGIYAMVEHMDTHLPEPECLFQIEYFRQDPAPFFQLARNVFAHAPAPSPTHRFLRLLQDRKQLLRLYSQNIDGLEEAAGVTRYIPCHGSFAWSSCMRCKLRVPTSSLMGAIRAGVIPTCARADCRGVLKPEITFFGELLSDRVSTSVTKDRLQADLLLVIGTSLKVSPVAEIPGFLPSHIPQVVINKTALKKKALKSNNKKPLAGTSSQFDLTLLGDCDEIIEQICQLAGWDLPAADSSAPPGTKQKSSDAPDVVTIESSSSDDDGDDDVEPRAARKPTTPRAKAKAVRVIEHPNKPNVLCFGECHCANKLGDRHNDDYDTAASGFVCDGCDRDYGGRSDSRTPYYSCDDCFDFDLCGDCYPMKARAHFHGAHMFSKLRC